MDFWGDVSRVNHSESHRDSFMPLGSPEEVLSMYEALAVFQRLAKCPDNSIRYKLEEGECVAFDNHRVLHGRTEYEIETGVGKRFLRGGYVDWEEINSRINVIRKKMMDKDGASLS